MRLLRKWSVWEHSKGGIVNFVPNSLTLLGSVTLRVEPPECFLLFSPEGERRWVPGWKPDLLYPIGVEWAEGQLFRSREEFGDAIWIVSKLDRLGWNVLYYRVEPGRYVANINIRVIQIEDARSKAIIAYSFVGLSEARNSEIASMSQSAFDEKMRRWSDWLEACLSQKE
jgi:hypothetical protein